MIYLMGFVIIVMGVSGSGKTTVGIALANELQFEFADGDDFHSLVNKAKMGAGTALSDDDRHPWLSAMSAAVKTWQGEDRNFVLACSALKDAYRREIIGNNERRKIVVVYLKANYKEIYERLKNRNNHFMKANMLDSQFATLEEPSDAIVVDAHKSVDAIVAETIAHLKVRLGSDFTAVYNDRQKRPE